MRSRGAIAFALAAALVVAFEAGASSAPKLAEPRLVLKIAALPQLSQYIHDTKVWTELYAAELFVPLGRRLRANGGLFGRSDFLLVRGGVAHDVWVSRTREWRAAAGFEYLVPLSDTEDLYRRLKGERSSTTDRLDVYLGLGQTFSLDRGRVAFRVEYTGRAVWPNAVFGMLESLDDDLGAGATSFIHEFAAGVELRLSH